MTKEKLIEAIKSADIVNDDMWWENLESQISNSYARGYLAASVSCFNESLGFNTEDFREEILEKVEYDIWREIPQPAGPVRVKAAEKLPEIRKEVFIYWLDEKWHKTTGWVHEDGYWITPFGTTKDNSKIEWLDESAPALFTRQDMEKALDAGVAIGVLCHQPEMAKERCEEYMSTNYGDKAVK